MVREVREENLPQVRKLILSILDEDTASSTAVAYCNRLEEHLKEDSLWYYLLDDKEVAVLGVEGKNHISLCFTDPDYRGRGAAKELFEAIKPVFLARGLFQITADAVPASEDFFRKLGFRKVEKAERTEEKQDRIFMVYRF